MSETYGSIWKNVLNYIPSKILVVVNYLLIIPLLANLYSDVEMSYYFIGLQFINIICTCSSDWITKATIRYHKKFDLKESAAEFYSTLLWFSIIVTSMVILVYMLCANLIVKNFDLSMIVIFQTVFIIFPCAIRQFLFQYLRVTNNPFIYTMSIMMYQAIFVILIVIFSKCNLDVSFIFVAMNIAMFLVDLYIIRKVDLKYTVKLNFNSKILKEISLYSSPLLLTNICYWLVLHFSKLYFQEKSLFTSTAVIGFCMMLVSYVIQSLASAFIFACFPVIVDKFERAKDLKSYWTKAIQLYIFCIFPIVMAFCCFFNNIAGIVFPQKYLFGAVTLPFFALSVFIHEFLKLVTVKYHLNNTTYTETFVSIAVLGVSIFINLILLSKYGVLGAAIALCVTELLFVVVNLFIKTKNIEYIAIGRVLKSLLYLLITCFSVFFVFHLLFNFQFTGNIQHIINIIKLVLYLTVCYCICFKLRKYILN